MREKLRRFAGELGALGLASLALLAAAAALHLLVLSPMEATRLGLEARARQLSPRSDAEQPASGADKLGALYEFLRKEEQPTDWLAKLHAIGAATGVQLSSATYRTPQAEGRIARYEMVLPLAGSYAQIRDFLQRSLTEIPVMSLDQLTLKRENRNERAVRAELRLTLHMVKP